MLRNNIIFTQYFDAQMAEVIADSMAIDNFSIVHRIGRMRLRKVFIFIYTVLFENITGVRFF